MLKLRLVPIVIALFSASPAYSQTSTYRWIDKATGQTIFSDKPPPPGAKQVTQISGRGVNDDRQLPYATRQAADKFPVTLFTTASCVEECNAARGLLNGRAIPFAEKMLKTEEEIADLSRRLGSEAGVPSLSVGQQYFKGYEPGSWNNLLDLAGYPKSAPYGAQPSGAFAR